MKCSVCGNEIVGFGNNPAPLKGSLICDDCNFKLTIPLRIFFANESDETALVLNTDNTISFINSTNKKITLKQLQRAVGGLIEIYPSRNIRYKLICNEEGLIRDLKPNRLAKKLLNVDVRGNLVLLPNKFLYC